MDKTALERAFEIARSGACEKVEDIRKQLAHEGFDRRQVEGRALSQQLRDTCLKARQAAAS